MLSGLACFRVRGRFSNRRQQTKLRVLLSSELFLVGKLGTRLLWLLLHECLAHFKLFFDSLNLNLQALDIRVLRLELRLGTSDHLTQNFNLLFK